MPGSSSAVSSSTRSAPPPRLILASASPRRRELLAGLGLELRVAPVDVDESPRPSEGAKGYVERLAWTKAQAALTRETIALEIPGLDGDPGDSDDPDRASDRGEAAGSEPSSRSEPSPPRETLVVAADTVVTVDGALLGKPADEAEAKAMLRRLSGRAHEVLTGVAVGRVGRGRVGRGEGSEGPEDAPRPVLVDAVERSRVVFAELTDDEIDWYVSTGEPMDKAGAYAIQGVAALFVERVEGNWSNVVGLPLPTTYRLFAELGVDLKSLSTASSSKVDRPSEPTPGDPP